MSSPNGLCLCSCGACGPNGDHGCGRYACNRSATTPKNEAPAAPVCSCGATQASECAALKPPPPVVPAGAESLAVAYNSASRELTALRARAEAAEKRAQEAEALFQSAKDSWRPHVAAHLMMQADRDALVRELRAEADAEAAEWDYLPDDAAELDVMRAKRDAADRVAKLGTGDTPAEAMVAASKVEALAAELRAANPHCGTCDNVLRCDECRGIKRGQLQAADLARALLHGADL
jgi:hypothetical protein